MSAPDYSHVPSEPIKGTEPFLPSYSSINPPVPTNVPLQTQGFPAPQQTAIVPYMAEIPGVPAGLEYLTQIDQVIIREKYNAIPALVETVHEGHQQCLNFLQEVDFTKSFLRNLLVLSPVGGQTWGRSYELLNVLNQRIFFAKQEIQCCGPLYNLHLTDNNSKEVMQLLQNCKCTCSPDIEIHCPPGNIIGYSVWNWSAFVTSLSIQNATRQTVLVVVGPGFQQNIFGDVNFEEYHSSVRLQPGALPGHMDGTCPFISHIWRFQLVQPDHVPVKSNDETQTVGMIRRESGQFTVQFPLDLDVNIKAVLIGSSFFLDAEIYSRRMKMLRDAQHRRH